MTTLATGTIKGHEARGDVTISQDGDVVTMNVENLWIAPGAPDTRVYISPREDGEVDGKAIELQRPADGTTSWTTTLPATVEVAKMNSIIVYCKIYSVYFGTATLFAT